MNLNYVLWFFMFGVATASVYTFYVKKILGGFVRKLLDANALSKESAVSLEELGISKPNFLLKRSLLQNNGFSETVRSSDGKYYISEDQIEKAEKKYKDEGMSVFVVLLVVFACALIALICTYVFPELIDMAKKLFE